MRRTGVMEPGSARRAFAATAVAAALALTAGGASAAASDRGPGVQGLDGSLAAVATTKPADAAHVARGQGLRVRDGRVVVEVVTRRGETSTAERSVRELGGTVSSDAPGVLEAEVAPGDLAALARADAVADVRAPAIPYPTAITGEGVANTLAAQAQAEGTTGAGVKVAVIDVDFKNYMARQASGDLPSSVTTQNYCAGGFENDTAQGHGAGVAEIVHEMAPDAQLYLICIDSSADLAAAEQYAKNQGVRIVNHSVAYFNTSRGDGSGVPGTPDDTVERARADGILWVNSAGNYARNHWGGQFNGNGNSIHDWVTGDETNTVTINQNQKQCFYLKWDAWPVTNQDFNFFLFRSSDNAQVAQSTGIQNGSQPPTEGFCYTNPNPSQNFYLRVTRVSGSSSPRLDVYAPDTGSLERFVTAGSAAEPATAPEVFGVGAYCFSNGGLESFSSQGPTIDGRIKPDISGPDRVSNATFGLSTGNCGGGFPGTSAASPHVAGAAALVAQGSSASPDAIQAVLEGSALHGGSPGKNNQFGSGGLRLTDGQPDLVVDGAGDGDYEEQVIKGRRKLRAGKKLTFNVTVQDDGPLSAAVDIDGDVKRKKVKAKFTSGGTNVTKKVRRGSFSPVLAFADSTNLKMTLKASKQAKSGKRSFELFATNDDDPTLEDAAKLQVRVKGH
jgi:Subtilase family